MNFESFVCFDDDLTCRFLIWCCLSGVALVDRRSTSASGDVGGRMMVPPL